MLPILRTRLSLALVAGVVVALELTLMRGLAIRLSSHFAGLVISVGLLGFGAAGSFLTLFRPFILRHQRETLALLALLLAVTIPATWWLSQLVPLNVNYLMWNIRWDIFRPFTFQIGADGWRLLEIELLMLVPFALGGAFIGVVLMDEPRRINGHYAADLLGSGLGGIAVVLAMNLHSSAEILVGLTVIASLAAWLVADWKDPLQIALACAFAETTIALLLPMPWQPAANPYKPLTLVRNFQGTQEIYASEGPLGRIDVVSGPMLHSAPQLSLQYFDDLPPHAEIYTDGDGPTLIFDRHHPDQWDFVNYRTAALPFFVHDQQAPPKVCILGAGGGVEIGLALQHHATDITALEANPQIIQAMRGPLRDLGGSIYDERGVHILNQEARGFFASTADTFDIIDFPPAGGFGAAGSDATQESYYYTTQSLRAMLAHLAPGGILALTRGINAPPREELRAFDLAAQTLRQQNLDPATHLAMIRGSFSCTILIFRDTITAPQIAALRAFCKRMSFDPCYFPGLTDQEANPFYEKLSQEAAARRVAAPGNQSPPPPCTAITTASISPTTSPAPRPSWAPPRSATPSSTPTPSTSAPPPTTSPISSTRSSGRAMLPCTTSTARSRPIWKSATSCCWSLWPRPRCWPSC